MAEELNEDESTEVAEGRGKKKALTMVGALFALIGVAYFASLMAVPAKDDHRVFDGPFVAPLSSEQVTVNLRGSDSKRYLVMQLSVEYDSYDEQYVPNRTANQLYNAMLRDALIGVASQKTVEEATDAVGRELLIDELALVVEPLIFPLHLGSGGKEGADEMTGLRAGFSSHKSTMRGPLDDHVVHLDTASSTLRLDDGPAVKYSGSETDLMVMDDAGRTVFLDVTRIEGPHDTDVNVGVMGRIRNIYRDSYLVQ
jgi:flagellar basal body-associated protein FliL